MIESKDYTIVVFKLRPEDGTGYIALAPDLHGCMSDGETQEEAVANCVQAIKEWIDVAERHGREIPPPGSMANKQAEAREKITKEIAELRREIDAVSQRIEEASPTWTPEFLLVAAKRGRTEDIVH